MLARAGTMTAFAFGTVEFGADENLIRKIPYGNSANREKIRKRTIVGTKQPNNFEFMICTAMCGSGARTGMEIIRVECN